MSSAGTPDGDDKVIKSGDDILAKIKRLEEENTNLRIQVHRLNRELSFEKFLASKNRKNDSCNESAPRHNVKRKKQS